MYFGDFNTQMFTKLFPSARYLEFKLDDEVYSKNDLSNKFYFLMKGTVHVVETSSTGEEKISSIHNKNEIFGHKKLISDQDIPERRRRAEAKEDVILLEFDTLEYENVRTQRVLSTAEKKIEYLIRYIPGFRSVDIKIIQDLEVNFIKEKVTKGYRLLHQDKPNDYIYFIFSGECRILFNYNSNCKLKHKFDSLDKSMPSLITIGNLDKGDTIGITSALRATNSPYSVQATSDEVVLYKIKGQKFIDTFGGDKGAPVRKLRAKSIMDSNWVKAVLKRLCKQSIETIMSQ